MLEVALRLAVHIHRVLLHLEGNHGGAGQQGVRLRGGCRHRLTIQQRPGLALTADHHIAGHAQRHPGIAPGGILSGFVQHIAAQHLGSGGRFRGFLHRQQALQGAQRRQVVITIPGCLGGLCLLLEPGGLLVLQHTGGKRQRPALLGRKWLALVFHPLQHLIQVSGLQIAGQGQAHQGHIGAGARGIQRIRQVTFVAEFVADSHQQAHHGNIGRELAGFSTAVPVGVAAVFVIVTPFLESPACQAGIHIRQHFRHVLTLREADTQGCLEFLVVNPGNGGGAELLTAAVGIGEEILQRVTDAPQRIRGEAHFHLGIRAEIAAHPLAQVPGLSGLNHGAEILADVGHGRHGIEAQLHAIRASGQHAAMGGCLSLHHPLQFHIAGAVHLDGKMHRDRGIPLQSDNLVALRQLHILPTHGHNPADGSTVGRLGQLGRQHTQRHRQHQFIALGGAHGGGGLQHHRLGHVVAGLSRTELVPRCGHGHEAVAREGIRVGISGGEAALGIGLHRGKPERAGIEVLSQVGSGRIGDIARAHHLIITATADEYALVAEITAAQVLAHQLTKTGEGAHAVTAAVHAVEMADGIRQVIPHHLQGAFILRKESHLGIRHRFSGGISNHAAHLAGFTQQQGLLRSLELHFQLLFRGFHPHKAGSHLEQRLAIGPAGTGILHQTHAHIHTGRIRGLQRHLNHRVGHRHLAAQVAQHLAAFHRHQQLGIHRGLHQHAGCLARLVRILFGQQHQPGITHVFPG